MHYLLTVDYGDFEKATLFFWKQTALHVTYFCVFSLSLFFLFSRKRMQPSYTWIFITGIIVFFLIIIILLFFSRSPIELPLSFNGDLEDIPSDSEEEIATLSEDARLSYERAKSKQINKIYIYISDWSNKEVISLARTSSTQQHSHGHHSSSVYINTRKRCFSIRV